MNNRNQPKLLILADDLTGALDSGVQLTRKGEKVMILTDYHDINHAPDADVLVINTDTRHMKADEAFRIIYTLVQKASEDGIRQIYKKTDSGLRGNVGAELSAVMKASGRDHLNFIPAWPAAGRTTIRGVHYVNGLPLSESVFSKDPIDPVKESRIDKLIHSQSNVPVTSGTDNIKKGIIVYDAETNDDLRHTAEQLEKENDLSLTAGCAGFLEVYPLSPGTRRKRTIPKLPDKLLVLSGSVNEVTKQQFAHALQNGAVQIHIPLQDILNNAWSSDRLCTYAEKILNENSEKPLLIIDTLENGNMSGNETKINSVMGQIAGHAAELSHDRTLMIIGGDTLQAFIRKMKIWELEPVLEIDQGVVLASYKSDGRSSYVLTKSGGFGTENQLDSILNWLRK